MGTDRFVHTILYIEYAFCNKINSLFLVLLLSVLVKWDWSTDVTISQVGFTTFENNSFWYADSMKLSLNKTFLS